MNTQHQITVVGRETSISGQMSMTGTAKILGQFEGRIAVAGDVLIAQGAIVRADILADQIVIEGEVEGNVTARERLQLASTAQLVGDIATRALVVEDGASLLGNCHVGANAAENAGTERSTQQAPARPSGNAKPPVSVASIGMNNGMSNGSSAQKKQSASMDTQDFAAIGERAAG
ncbi:MAG: bactofilin family protein [Phycisphaerales bacterium]